MKVTWKKGNVLKIKDINKMPSRKILGFKRILIFAICISALILLLFVARLADPRVEFNDSGLEDAVRVALDNKYKPIIKDDLLSITILDASNRGITRLDGIEYFKNLVSLNLEGNSIEDIRNTFSVYIKKWHKNDDRVILSLTFDGKKINAEWIEMKEYLD